MVCRACGFGGARLDVPGRHLGHGTRQAPPADTVSCKLGQAAQRQSPRPRRCRPASPTRGLRRADPADRVRFAPDGRVFVAEKSGLHQGLRQRSPTPTPTVFADLETEVDDYWDRGLLGLALDPNFPATPVHLRCSTPTTHRPGGNGAASGTTAARPPRARRPTAASSAAGSSRIQRPATHDGPQQMLISDWCQQFPSHSIGDLRLRPRRRRCTSRGGDGASFNYADYGQDGGGAGSPTPANPCGDPPAGRRDGQTPPTAEGGALRSPEPPPRGRRAGAAQRRRPARRPGDRRRGGRATRSSSAPTRTRGGSSPTACATRSASPSGPARASSGSATSAGTTGRRSTGVRPDRRQSQNFGWPCYEGTGAAARLPERRPEPLQQPLRAPDRGRAPYYTYKHGDAGRRRRRLPDGERLGRSARSRFYTGGSYPAAYNGALFFADHSRNCIWAMPTGHERAARSGEDPAVRRRGGEPRRPRVGPGRRPLLRRLRRRHDPPHLVARPGSTARPVPSTASTSTTSR